MLIKKIIWAIFLMLLTACQGARVSQTPTSTMQSKTLTPFAKHTSLPTSTPLSLPTLVSVTQTPQTPVEHLAFTVATNIGGMYSDTVIAFANSDGTGFETPNIFEPFSWTGGVTGSYLVWSPNARYLAFDGANEIKGCGVPNSDCFATNYGTFLIDYSMGSIVQQVDRTVTNSSWSPDSQRLVLSIGKIYSGGGKSNTGDLYILDLKSGRKIQLTKSPFNDLYPSWSPNGQWIAFLRYNSNLKRCGIFPITDSSYDCDNASLFVIHPDGSGRKLLASSVHIETPISEWERADNAPKWSPDSRWLAIMIESEGLLSLFSQEIALVNVETGEFRRLTNNMDRDVFPSWSSDGKQLAFVRGLEGNADIFVMNADGTNPINLTNSSTWVDAPVWSPSGNYLAFISRGKLYIMNTDGTNQTPINGEYVGVIGGPAWFPIVKP